MKKLFSMGLCVSLLMSMFSGVAFASSDEDIVILYENDVHCAVDGYAKLSAMKNELLESNKYVGVVSSGDFIQGGSLGSISKGEYIINLMNMVGYDAVALGNHEFDYKVDRLKELTAMLNAPTLSCNFLDINNKNVFAPFTIVKYGDKKVAYVGITTPSTLIEDSPLQFVNSEGEYMYSFCGENLYKTVQNSIDEAKREGADYVIALSHLGNVSVEQKWGLNELVKNTSGLNVVLDAHSHSVLPSLTLKDKSGKEVLVSSTGTKFEYIGKLCISDDMFKTELVKVDSYAKTDENIVNYIEKINNEYKILGERKIGEVEYKLATTDENGKRIVRNNETNLGDLCADAYKDITGADISLMNSGGIRADIAKGEITYNDVFNVFPFGNIVCTAELSGEDIVNALEYSAQKYPKENAAFLQVSGLKYTLDEAVKSGIVLDENNAFKGIVGDRRVKDVEVWDKVTGKYVPIDLNKKYTVASHSYYLKEQGDGYAMFKNASNLVETGIVDVELLEDYISENLAGKVGSEYSESQNRVNVIKEYLPLRAEFEAKGYKVDWNKSDSKKVVVTKNDRVLIFTVDSNIVYIDNERFVAKKNAYVENGKTYVSADCLAM